MEVILKETIDTLGPEGSIVQVKPGYARNYLIPQKKAVAATKSNLAILEQERKAIEARLAKQQQIADALAGKLSGITVEIARKAGDENRLFGSVTSADIAAKVQEQGIDIDRKAIMLPEPIKTLGETKVKVKTGFQTTSEITVLVVPEGVEDSE